MIIYWFIRLVCEKKTSGSKRDYLSVAMKRKSKQKEEEVIKNFPYISSIVQQSASVSDSDCDGKY